MYFYFSESNDVKAESICSTCDRVKRSLMLSFGIADTIVAEAGFCEAA